MKLDHRNTRQLLVLVLQLAVCNGNINLQMPIVMQRYAIRHAIFVGFPIDPSSNPFDLAATPAMLIKFTEIPG
jgi:hypothetical protein